MSLTKYPDVSSHNEGLSLAGVPAVCAKATQGTSYVNPLYPAQIGHAAAPNAFGFAYHFLEGANPMDQADHCFDVVGNKHGLMVDVEPTINSNPTLADTTTFIDRYRKHGGIVHLAYFPHWWWVDLGQPDFKPLRDRNIYIVSSDYPSAGYTSDGPGWDAYGGNNPLIWQYTANGRLNNGHCDFNAFRGTVAELRNYVLTGKKGDPVTTGWRVWYTKGHSSLADVSKSTGMACSTILRVTVEHFGPFDDVISTYVNDVFEGRKQFTDKIPAGDEKTTGRLWVRG